MTDSYVAPPYDRRREADFRRRDYGDRDRGSWDRARDRDYGQRYREHDSDYDRNRRAFERDRPHERDRPFDRHKEHYGPPARRGPSPRRDAQHRRSRSPPRRGPSPGPSYRRPRSRSPLLRSPPPHKRMKLGNHSIDARQEYGGASPPGPGRNFRGRSRSQSRRSRSRSPAHGKRGTTPQSRAVAKPEESKPLPPPAPTVESLTTLAPEISAPGRICSPTPPTQVGPTLHTGTQVESTAPSPPIEPPVDKHAETTKEVEPEGPQVVEEIKPCGRSRSPPRQPRHPGPPAPPTLPPSASRSPPRGPRNYSRGNVTPTGPASSLPPGPRGQRRTYPGPTAPPAPSISQDRPPAATEEKTPSVPELEIKVPMPYIPPRKLPPSLTLELDAEIARLQAHRAHLASEYAQLAAGKRRALHELEMSTIDLRAAELRRKVADIQYQKARNGVLGVDYVPTDTSIG
ncbi:hypothetical protein LshimejAT787_0206830 [Lyophyllum shimeji]|uniref:Uncharacterized protein n=1 Tax=Lyophyllum shimeji TaxID=47721 RepID=A0A9P3PGP7_LYOSH|nr:hypothetical protein LshimejAT787_0206830 [Lyophyllum shimeji]